MAAGQQAAPVVENDPPGLRIAIFVVAVVVLLGLSLFMLSDVPDVGRSHGWQITLLVMAWSGLRLAGICASGEPRLFDFFFWLFVFLFLGLAPTVQIRLNDVSGTTPGMNPSLDVPTAGVVVLGIAAYELGRLLTRPRESRTAEPALRRGPGAARLEPGWGLNLQRSILLLGGALLFTTYFVSRLGVGTLFSSRDAAGAVATSLWPDTAVLAVIGALAAYPLLIATGALAQLRKGFPERWRRPSLVGLTACVVLLLMITNPISSARYVFGTVAFAIAAFLGAVATRHRARLTMVGTLGGFLFLFPLADAFRRSDQAASFARTGFFAEYAGNADYDGFWQIANALSYWLAGLVEPGRQVLGSALFWVPRSIWANKPTDTGIVLARFRGYTFDNLSAPLWAEGLVNLGLVGVVVALGLLGVLAGRMDRRLVQGLLQGGRWAVVGAVFPVYLVILLRGSLLQATGGLMVAVACTVFVSSRAPQGDGPPVGVEEEGRHGVHAHLP